MNYNSPSTQNINGILVINKPASWTSFDVVAKMRNNFNIKKVGHTGTLDPMARGVLVLCLGKATKLIEYMVKDEKEYFAEITLGANSNTDDAEGEIVAVKDPKKPTQEEIENTLEQFMGTIDQIPPQFSAKKIKGQKAYELARKGKTVDLKPVKITIHSIKLVEYKWPIIKVHIHCGSGTYVRAIARDIGKKLECGGHLSLITRTRVGPYALDQACILEAVNEGSIQPLSSALQHLPAYPLNEQEFQQLKSGRPIPTALNGPIIVGTRLTQPAIIIRIKEGRMVGEKILQ